MRWPPPFIAIPGALVCAFMLGRFTANPGAGNDGDNDGKTSTRAARGLSPASTPDNGRPGAAGGLATTALADAAGKNIEDHARLMVTEKRTLARSALLENLIERITSDNWLSVFEVMWRAREQGMISEREEHLFMQRFGEVAGRAAMNRFRPRDPVKNFDTHSGRQAMRGWAQADPAAARAWLEAQPEGNYRVGMADGFVRGAAAQDPAGALRAAKMLGPDAQQALINAMLKLEEAPHYVPFVEQWLTSGPLDAAAPATGQIRSQVFDRLVEAKIKALWGDRDGSQVTAWIEQFAGREFVSSPALSRVAENLAGHMDASRVMELMDRLAAPGLPAQTDPIRGVMQRWSRDDPGAAQEWLHGHRDAPHYDAAAFSFIQNAGIADPAVQRAWIETLHDEALRAQAMRRFNETQKAAPSGR